MYIKYDKNFDVKGLNKDDFNDKLQAIKGTQDEGDIEVKISLVVRTKEGNKIMLNNNDIDLVIPLEELSSTNYYSVVASIKKALEVKCPSFNEECIWYTALYPTGFLYFDNILYMCLTLVIEIGLIPFFIEEDNNIQFINIDDINLKSISERNIIILPTIPKTRR